MPSKARRRRACFLCHLGRFANKSHGLPIRKNHSGLPEKKKRHHDSTIASSYDCIQCLFPTRFQRHVTPLQVDKWSSLIRDPADNIRMSRLAAK